MQSSRRRPQNVRRSPTQHFTVKKVESQKGPACSEPALLRSYSRPALADTFAPALTATYGQAPQVAGGQDVDISVFG